MDKIVIHTEDNLFCLNDIAEHLIKSTNIKEFMKKIPNKKSINGNFYITKETMVEILEKSKSVIAHEYLGYINKENIKNKKLKKYNKETNNKETNNIEETNKHITSKEQLQEKIVNRNFVDYGTNEILYGNTKILFFEFNETIYFKGKDICSLLDYENYRSAIIKYVDKEDTLTFEKGIAGGEGVVKRDPQSPQKLEKIKLKLEKQSNKYIENNTTFINESGLYSLILSSKMPKAKEFKRWVTNDVLVNIRKTGVYNKNPKENYYDASKIKELTNETCVYLLRIENNLYKFGITNNLSIRITNHKRYLNYDEIIEIYPVPNYNIALKIESQIKNFANNSKIRKICEKGIEFFETNNEYSLEKILGEIKNIVDNEIKVYDNKEDTIKINLLAYIEKQKIKQLELKCKKIELKEISKQNEIQLKISLEKEKTKQLELELELEKLKLISNNVLSASKKLVNDVSLIQTVEKANQLAKKIKQVKQSNPLDNEANPENIPAINNCISCNKVIYETSTRCIQCESKVKFNNAVINSNRPSLSQLTEDLKKLGTYVQVGIKYNVSDNCIRKWIKKYKYHQEEI